MAGGAADSGSPGMILRRLAVLLFPALLVAGCSSKPLNPWTADYPPQAMVPVAEAGIDDQRGRFREIFCAVLESRGEEWPDYRTCDEALTRVGEEPAGTGEPVNLGKSDLNYLVLAVPGVGWECIENWLKIDASVQELLDSYGYAAELIRVDGLSSSANNARQIRDYIEALPAEHDGRPIVLIGYSKGAPDILEAIVNYPELLDRVRAVISVAGAIGGSPLANTADQEDLNIMLHFPGANCSQGDGGALDSLQPETRRTWLAQNPLPDGILYYSLVTFPQPDRMSSVLRKLHQEVFVNPAKHVTGSSAQGLAIEDTQQIFEQIGVEAVIVLRKMTGERLKLRLDGIHGIYQRLTQFSAFW